jgi:hypothetical protein
MQTVFSQQSVLSEWASNVAVVDTRTVSNEGVLAEGIRTRASMSVMAKSLPVLGNLEIDTSIF